MNIEPGYEKLAEVLQEALDQAQSGKGKERHANNEPFEEQQICQGARKHGLGAMSYQVEKKINEARRLFDLFGPEEAKPDILGAINYAAAMLIVINEYEQEIEENFAHKKDKQPSLADFGLLDLDERDPHEKYPPNHPYWGPGHACSDEEMKDDWEPKSPEPKVKRRLKLFDQATIDLWHNWFRAALEIDEDAPYRFDYYAQVVEDMKNTLQKPDPTTNPDNVPNDPTPSDCPTFYDRLNFWREEQYQKLGINCNDQKD
jgi:hypothetical protein